jgi:hypothetical protein
MAEKAEKLGASFGKAVGGKLKLKGVEFKGYECEFKISIWFSKY